MENNELNMETKLSVANENIYILSEKVVNLIKQRDENYCCNNEKMINGCNSECEKCKEEHYRKMLENIYNELKVE